MRVHVRTIQRFSMREEDTHGSWKRLYLKLAAPLGAFMEGEREGGREIYERQIGFYASLDSGCNSGSIINTRRCNF